jgi:hypothetical protein
MVKIKKAELSSYTPKQSLGARFRDKKGYVIVAAIDDRGMKETEVSDLGYR